MSASAAGLPLSVPPKVRVAFLGGEEWGMGRNKRQPAYSMNALAG